MVMTLEVAGIPRNEKPRSCGSVDVHNRAWSGEDGINQVFLRGWDLGIGRCPASGWHGRSRKLETRRRASPQYREFLALWKSADPDLRILIEANAEYKKLSASSQSPL
jgi:hypothetical protein